MSILTTRQSQIMRLIAKGFTDKEIARELGISRKTVDTHMRRVFAQLDVRSRTVAVVRWLNAESSVE
jgi:DNA-binding NarL/FixJ family response regulator